MYFWCICGEEGDLRVLLFHHLEAPPRPLVLLQPSPWLTNVCWFPYTSQQPPPRGQALILRVWLQPESASNPRGKLDAVVSGLSATHPLHPVLLHFSCSLHRGLFSWRVFVSSEWKDSCSFCFDFQKFCLSFLSSILNSFNSDKYFEGETAFAWRPIKPLILSLWHCGSTEILLVSLFPI